MFAGCKVEGISVVFTPFGAEPGITVVEGGSALVSNGVTAATGRAAPGDVHDLDDVCRA